MAENAASQTLLSGYAKFDAVGASSAFTRDTRVELRDSSHFRSELS